MDKLSSEEEGDKVVVPWYLVQTYVIRTSTKASGTSTKAG